MTHGTPSTPCRCVSDPIRTEGWSCVRHRTISLPLRTSGRSLFISAQFGTTARLGQSARERPKADLQTSRKRTLNIDAMSAAREASPPYSALLSCIYCVRQAPRITHERIATLSKCNSEFTYEDGSTYICPECAHEWSAQAAVPTETNARV